MPTRAAPVAAQWALFVLVLIGSMVGTDLLMNNRHLVLRLIHGPS